DHPQCLYHHLQARRTGDLRRRARGPAVGLQPGALPRAHRGGAALPALRPLGALLGRRGGSARRPPLFSVPPRGPGDRSRRRKRRGGLTRGARGPFKPLSEGTLGGLRSPIVASFSPATRELVLKIVYYGPGLGGKTTTLKSLHA